MYARILVPLDGSELAEISLPYAEELAVRLGSEITLLSVSESHESESYNELLTYALKMAEFTKNEVERNLAKLAGKAIKVDSKILVGHPAEEIVDYVDKADIDLIVMATHGRSGIGRWALGSVADKVVRATKRPVALIRAKGARPDVREKGILNKALVPLDGSKESEAVIPYIEELASKLKTEVVLLQVVVASVESYLEKVDSQLRGKGITVKSEVRFGSVAEEIIKLADEIHADVVAMSTHGQSGVSRWVFGSVANRVLHEGNTPLLLVRTPGARTE